MFEPSPVRTLIDLPPTGETVRVPAEPFEADLFFAPALVVLGCDYYEATLHPELDIFTSWTAVMHGAVAAQFTVEPVWWE